MWEAEWSKGFYLPAAVGATGAQAGGTVVKTPVALMALRGQKVTKVTIAACTPGRTAGVVTVVKLGPEGVDGGKFIAQSVRAATVYQKYWPLSELAFADSGCGGGTPLPIGAGEPVRVLEVLHWWNYPLHNEASIILKS